MHFDTKHKTEIFIPFSKNDNWKTLLQFHDAELLLQMNTFLSQILPAGEEDADVGWGGGGFSPCGGG